MTSVVLALATLLSATPRPPFEAEVDCAVAESARIFPVPRALVFAVISVESGFRPRAVSRAGAKGLMQLMPSTAGRVGIAEADLFDPRKNIVGGVRLLALLLRHYDGDLIATLVAYNARPRRIFAPIPHNGETPIYVWSVLARVRHFTSCEPPLAQAALPFGRQHAARMLRSRDGDKDSRHSAIPTAGPAPDLGTHAHPARLQGVPVGR